MEIARRRLISGLAASALYAALPSPAVTAVTNSSFYFFGKRPSPSAIRTVSLPGICNPGGTSPALPSGYTLRKQQPAGA